MFDYIRKLILQSKIKNENSMAHTAKDKPADIELSRDIDSNVQNFKNILGSSPDIVVREFDLGGSKRIRGALVYIEGLANIETIESNLLKPLMYDKNYTSQNDMAIEIDLDYIYNHLISFGDVKKVSMLNDSVKYILSGETALIVDAEQECLLISAKKWEKRAIEEPATENVVRGPREGFIETMRTNTSMLRRIIKNPKLRFDPMEIGEQTTTRVAIAYIDGIANMELIDELKQRLSRITIDSVLDSGYVQAYIEDSPTSIFQTVGSSERPDAVAGKLLEGRAAILVDGSPFVLTVPMLFIENFQSAEDYYIKSYYATTLRSVRAIAYLIAILAPAIYVALTTYHQELIPSTLLFTLVAGHEAIPFPSLIEAIMMLLTFDIMKEAGIRLPKPVGSAVSIVGALVLGQAAVSAGIIGPFMVIVVSLTAIASFVVPSQSDSVLIMRYFLLIMAGFLGGFGVVMGILLILTHLVSISSFGVAYLSPLSPYSKESIKDAFIRAPLWKMSLRPNEFDPVNKQRRMPDTRLK